MKHFNIFLLVGFIILSVFGILDAHADMGSHGDGCIAAAARGTDCPMSWSSFEYLAFHADAFRSFFAAVFERNGFLILASFFFLVALRVVFKILFDHTVGSRRAFLREQYVKPEWFDDLPQKRELIHWLAFHENSPSFS